VNQIEKKFGLKIKLFTFAFPIYQHIKSSDNEKNISAIQQKEAQQARLP
jgi:hypothetical protein